MTVHISTVGTIGTDPKLIIKPEGVAFCAFRIAVSERRFDRELRCWQDGPTSWFSVTSFRTLAEHAHTSLSKGDRVFISGKLRTRQWERDGKTGTSVDIEADALGHDLRWGTSEFTKRAPSDASAQEEHNTGWPLSPADTSVTPERSTPGLTQLSRAHREPEHPAQQQRSA